MKILRTIIWVLAAIGFLIFAAYNWQPVELQLWQNLVLETKVPMLVLLAFLAGFVPMWALHRSVVWNQNRRIRARAPPSSSPEPRGGCCATSRAPIPTIRSRCWPAIRTPPATSGFSPISAAAWPPPDTGRPGWNP